MKVINLFAGPGAGKSTTAAGVFHLLKIRGHSAELVGEFAKDLTWEKRFGALNNQLYVLGKQYHRLDRLRGQVDFVVVDSPLLLSCIYMPYTIAENAPAVWQVLAEDIDAAAHSAFRTFDNLNFFINRTKVYKEAGRSQTEEQARRLDSEILDMLLQYNYDFTRVDGYEDAALRIADQVTGAP